MNSKLDILALIERQTVLIENGRREALEPKDSLGRMMRTAIRQGRHDDAKAIYDFLQITQKEIDFFRLISQIGRNNPKSGMIGWVQNYFPSKPDAIIPKKTDDTITKQLNPDTPFFCLEGVSSPFDGDKDKTAHSILGPYFAIFARNPSEAVDIKADKTFVLTFNRASANSSHLDLRIWRVTDFKERFIGNSLENSRILLLPDSSQQVIKITGTSKDVFLEALDYMERAALSRNPPQTVSDNWLAILRDYADIPKVALTPQ